MCVCVCVCVFVCVCVCVCIIIYIYNVYIYTYIHTHTHTCMYVCMHVILRTDEEVFVPSFWEPGKYDGYGTCQRDRLD